MQACFFEQILRLACSTFLTYFSTLSLVYPLVVLTAAAETFLQKSKESVRNTRLESYHNLRQNRKKYVQRLLHNLKKIANRYEIAVVLSAQEKLARVFAHISHDSEHMRQCGTMHGKLRVNCSTRVLCEISPTATSYA